MLAKIKELGLLLTYITEMSNLAKKKFGLLSAKNFTAIVVQTYTVISTVILI